MIWMVLLEGLNSSGVNIYFIGVVAIKELLLYSFIVITIAFSLYYIEVSFLAFFSSESSPLYIIIPYI